MKYMILLSLLFTSSAFASLPPYWDRVSQIQTVLQSPELETALGGQEIEHVAKFGSDSLTYKVITAKCHTSVTLEIQTTEHPGPANYIVKAVETPTCN